MLKIGNISERAAVKAARSRLVGGFKKRVFPPTVVRKSAKKIKVCVLYSSYEGSDSPTEKVDDILCSPAFWLSRDKDKYEFVEVAVKKAESYAKIRELLSSGKYDVFYNLCDGGRDEKRAGVDVVLALEALNAAFTGSDSKSFEPNKVDMKVLVANANVHTPNFVLLDNVKDLQKKCRHLKFPVIVKHVSGYASVGITKDSRCETLEALELQVKKSIKEFNHALVEEFIRGREGTVLVCSDPGMPFGIRVFQPLMLSWMTDGDDFAHFESKWCFDFAVSFMARDDPCYTDVVAMARNAFHHIMKGVGYGRCDFRIDDGGKVYFLEINANCGMLYDPRHIEGGDYADAMVLNEEEYSHDDFVANAVRRAKEDQGRRCPWYCISHDAHGHFTTRASINVTAGTALYGGPVHPVPVIARALYTLGEDDATVGCVICRGDGINSVVAIRHSCEPNMYFVHGSTLTFESARSINKGEELSVDYSTLRDPEMPAFACSCGTASCRSVIFSDPPLPRQSIQRLRAQRRATSAYSASSASSALSLSRMLTKKNKKLRALRHKRSAVERTKDEEHGNKAAVRSFSSPIFPSSPENRAHKSSDVGREGDGSAANPTLAVRNTTATTTTDLGSNEKDREKASLFAKNMHKINDVNNDKISDKNRRIGRVEREESDVGLTSEATSKTTSSAGTSFCRDDKKNTNGHHIGKTHSRENKVNDIEAELNNIESKNRHDNTNNSILRGINIKTDVELIPSKLLSVVGKPKLVEKHITNSEKKDDNCANIQINKNSNNDNKTIVRRRRKKALPLNGNEAEPLNNGDVYTNVSSPASS